MDKRAKAHFKKADPILFEALTKIGDLEVMVTRVPKDHFSALCRAIIAQQLSTKVARVIFERFRALFPKEEITSNYLAKIKPEDLRKVGLSGSKVAFLKDLAEKVESKELDLKRLKSLRDEEVIEELIKVKGIGKWTAEMFLIFSLGREDVFSFGDLGLKRAIKTLYELKDEVTIEEIEKITLNWTPFRSYACRILWKSLG